MSVYEGKSLVPLKERLQQLNGQFDSRYWPSCEEVVLAISEFASEAEITPNDSWTEASISSRKSSKADFVRTLLTAIAERCTDFHNSIPEEFNLKNESLASFINVALDLDIDEIIDGPYVKTIRHKWNAKG